MKRTTTDRWRRFGWLLPFLLLTGCNVQFGTGDEEKKEKEEVVIPVEVAAVERGTVDATWHGTTTLQARDQARVVAEVSGVVREILVEEGDTVAAGQALARLDDEQLRLELKQAEVELSRLRQDFERARRMFRDKLLSQEAYDQIQFDLTRQETIVEQKRLRLRKSTIRAPIAGTVAERMIRVGNLIQANSPAFLVTRLDALEAVVWVPEGEISRLRPGQRAVLTVDAWPGERFEGRVARVSPVVDADTGTVKLTVTVDATGGRLRPGMFGRLAIYHDRHEQALLIPRDALLTEDARTSVFRVEEGVARRVEVVPGYGDGRRIEILEGLKEGDRVVTVGQITLKDGARVEVISDEEEGVEGVERGDVAG